MPDDAVMVMCCALLVALSLADTFTMPFASMSKVTSICGTPRGAGGRPSSPNFPSRRLSAAMGRSPWNVPNLLQYETMIEILEKDLNRLLGDTQGLLLGIAATLFPGVSTALRSSFGLPSSLMPHTFHDTIFENAAVKTDSPNDLQKDLAVALEAMTSGPTLQPLARIPWKAVLSATPDLRFEELFRKESDRHAHRSPPAVVTSLGQPIPPRCIPVFKLVGAVNRSDLVATRNQFLQRRSQWRMALRSFFDETRGSPILVMGMEESIDILRDVLVEMMAQSILRPRFLAVFSDDPISHNQEVIDLIDSFSTFCLIRAGSNSLAKASPSPSERSQATSARHIDVGALKALVTIVNDHLVPSSRRDERHRLLDLLFSPDTPSWEPFAHSMDFQRTSGTIIGDIKTLLAASPFVSSAVVLVGAAASGKTVVLKRLAYDLAKSGRTVIWLRPSTSSDSAELLVQFFKEVQKANAGMRVVIAMDDPPGFVSLSPREVIRAARVANVEFVFLTAVRASEWSVQDSTAFVGPLPIAIKEDLAGTLDEGELSAFPDYLVSLEIYANRGLAETAVRAVEKTAAVDLLSTLYWLLPQTKAVITSSVRDEYFRLGDVAGLSRVLLGAVNKTSKLLRDAYELVAVANHYRASLPVEVLVGALDVGYGEWLDAVPPGIAWGLLYADGDNASEELLYRTRSAVVTRILITTLNGGALNRSGEIGILDKLLGACTGSTAVYREFCVKILVNNETLASLEFQDGLRLFDRAIESLPLQDRTLLHQKAVWIRKKGHDPLTAMPILEQALAAQQYPYATQEEPDEHIHNSIAANYVDLIQKGLIDRKAGRAAAVEHLGLARSSEFFNTYSAHAHANMILSLLSLTTEEDAVDISTMSARALSDLDITLLMVRDKKSDFAASSEEDMEMLKAVRTKLLGRLKPIADLREDAKAQWDAHRSQSGFVVASLKALDEARFGAGGWDYYQAYDYVETAMQIVRESGMEVSPALAEAALSIYYAWRIARRLGTKNQANMIDWQNVRLLSSIALRSGRGGQDSYSQYLHGLALAHLGRWSDAQAVFASLRQLRIPPSILWSRRDPLVDENGTMMTVQGIIKAGGSGRIFLDATELGTDFPADRNETWPKSGGIAFAHIEFSFGGPTAIPVTHFR